MSSVVMQSSILHCFQFSNLNNVLKSFTNFQLRHSLLIFRVFMKMSKLELYKLTKKLCQWIFNIIKPLLEQQD